MPHTADNIEEEPDMVSESLASFRLWSDGKLDIFDRNHSDDSGSSRVRLHAVEVRQLLLFLHLNGVRLDI